MYMNTWEHMFLEIIPFPPLGKWKFVELDTYLGNMHVSFPQNRVQIIYGPLAKLYMTRKRQH